MRLKANTQAFPQDGPTTEFIQNFSLKYNTCSVSVYLYSAYTEFSVP